MPTIAHKCGSGLMSKLRVEFSPFIKSTCSQILGKSPFFIMSLSNLIILERASQASMNMSTLFFLLTLVFPLHLAFGNNVTLKSTLSTNDNNPVWLSSSGEFAFGFRQINSTSTDQKLFLLAIWYYEIPDKTIVWNANADKPAPIGSTVKLTTDGMALRNPQGEVIWTTGPTGLVSYGAMLDTGNFVLASTDASSSSTYVWESFNNPTDTLLPTQNLELQGKLTSRLSENNYTKGRFHLYFLNGTLFLSGIDWPSPLKDSRYSYFSVKMGSNESASVSQLVFDKSADIYLEKTNGGKILLGWDNSTLDPTAYYYRATLDFYGVFTQYSHPKGSSGQQGWSIVRIVPENICSDITSDLGSGSCGYNSYCTMEKENERPTCKCPDGYSLVDPNNQFGGCQPDFSFGCGADDAVSRDKPEEVFEFKVLAKVDWPWGDYESLEIQSIQDCLTNCMHDCTCAVAIFVNLSGVCWKKKLPLSNGRSSDGSHTVLLKTRIHALSNDAGSRIEGPGDLGRKKEDPHMPILLGSLIGSLVFNGVLVATVILILIFKPKKIGQAPSVLETNLHSFPYEKLRQYTQDFSEELGRGSFGIVYKGTLDSSPNQVVAVKKLDRMALEREKEFRTELSAIGKTFHKNLVRLIGFCDEGIHRLLVYEFMSNGTLANLLFGEAKPAWNLRVRIALGIARGLVYLHEECSGPIIHCDIKPQNILLDEHFTAKISDFGLAKLLLSDQSRTQTMIRGTRGYVASEWFKNVPVTVKVDVYSFGVLLLEIICCRRAVLMACGEEEKAILTDWAYDCLMEGRIDALVEEDKEAMADKGMLQRWVMIAIWCIQEHHEMRPAMKTVMHMLEGLVDVRDPPAPSFCVAS